MFGAIGKMFSFLHSDVVLKTVAVACGAAMVVKMNFPPYTLAYKAAEEIINFGVLLGVSSTTSREQK